MIAALLALGRPAARGALAAAAALTKLAPAVAIPLLATAGGRSRGVVARFALAFLATALLLLTPVLADPGTFLDRTVGYQSGRDSPFTIWGQVPALKPLRVAILAAVAALALLVALRPAVKDVAGVAALAAALLIGTQLAAQHWFYLYLVWFFPPALVTLAAIRPAPEAESARSSRPGRRDGSRPAPPSPRRPPPRSRTEPASV
jgi:uncharacterized membrane protein